MNFSPNVTLMRTLAAQDILQNNCQTTKSYQKIPREGINMYTSLHICTYLTALFMAFFFSQTYSISPDHNHATSSFNEGVPSCGIQEMNLLCHNSCSLEHHSPGDQISPDSTSLQQGPQLWGTDCQLDLLRPALPSYLLRLKRDGETCHLVSLLTHSTPECHCSGLQGMCFTSEPRNRRPHIPPPVPVATCCA